MSDVRIKRPDGSWMSLRGPQGLSPTNSELTAIITPLIPAPIPGEAGHTPTEQELLALIEPLIPAPTGGGVPSGVIVMWGGLVENIPSGWLLCDGQNGTPDLRDRFVKGVAAGGEAGGTGGAASVAYTPQGAVSQPTLSINPITEVVNHTHPVAVTDPGHAHVQGVNSATTGGLSGYAPDTSSNTRVNSGYSTSSATTGITAAAQNPAGGVSSITPTGTVSQPAFTGQQASIPTEPAYFRLCFIQKI